MNDSYAASQMEACIFLKFGVESGRIVKNPTQIYWNQTFDLSLCFEQSRCKLEIGHRETKRGISKNRLYFPDVCNDAIFSFVTSWRHV